MATVNKRVAIPQAMVINGIDAGGAMSIAIQAGHDNVIQTTPDGLQVPLKDKEVEFIRGSFVTQDWIHAIELLTGTVGTYVFYERKSGVAEATGYIKHTITNPVIHRANLRLNQRGYAALAVSFECRAADEAKGFADMWGQEDSQAAPSYVSAARGGYRVVSAAHGGSIDIYHATAFDLTLMMQLAKACNDGDVGYTAVDARLDGLRCSGSLSFEDTEISSPGGQMKSLQLLAASRGNLVLALKQSQGASNKTLTVAGVDFDSIGQNSSAESPFTGHTVNYEVSNDTALPLTLAGANKILTIA